MILWVRMRFLLLAIVRAVWFCEIQLNAKHSFSIFVAHHCQTIALDDYTDLYDCPGLVFPAVDMPREMQGEFDPLQSSADVRITHA